ncbi:MAG TPA: SCO family protein, partial [Desulfovibrio sp.]|nr:SCO family protein [Desulfovibrio sp.]
MRVRLHFLTVSGVRALVATASLLVLIASCATGAWATVPAVGHAPVLVAAADASPAAPGDAGHSGHNGHAGQGGQGSATMTDGPAGPAGHAPGTAAPAQDAHAGHGAADAAQPPAEHVHPVPPPTTGKLGQPTPTGQTGQTTQTGQPPQGAQPSLAGVDEHLGEIIPEGILLRDESGKPIDPRTLMDVPVIIAPIYYSCPTVCNMLQSSLARVLPQMSLQPGKDYRVLSVSFDETDTFQLAARKKQNYFAAMNFAYPEDGWRFLSGDLDSINRFMDAIGFRFTRQGRDFIHPVVLVVTAPGGKVVRYLYGQNFMPFDLTMAVTEASHGTIGLSVKRVLSYCFTYDPEGRRYVFDFMRIAGLIILFGAAVLLFVLVRGGPR